MFVLGVGAQKSGTTWLFNQLSRDPSFAPLDRKELHYWDQKCGLHQPGSKSMADVRKCFSAEAQIGSVRPTPVPGFLTTEYDYFDKIQQTLDFGGRGQSREPIVADVTPAYSGLPLFCWREIARELNQRALDYRVIFSMRDPVSRITSAMHHDVRQGKLKVGIDLDAIAIAIASSWAYQFRSRYELTLANLESAFPKEKIFVMFTEKISTDQRQHLSFQQSIGRNLDYFDRTTATTVAKYKPLDVETQMALARLFQHTYLDLIERYPFLSEIWPGVKLLES